MDQSIAAGATCGKHVAPALAALLPQSVEPKGAAVFPAPPGLHCEAPFSSDGRYACGNPALYLVRVRT